MSARAFALLLALAAACGAQADARQKVIVTTFVSADLSLLRARPRLVEGKYALMANDLYSFYRGIFPLFLRDCADGNNPASRSRFALDIPPVLALGDAHLENFGTLLASDGTFALEPNDFDSADRWPYLWDLRRLLGSLAIASRINKIGDPRAVARAGALAYAKAAIAYADGAERKRELRDASNPFIDDLFRRSIRDLGRREELDGLTKLENGARTLLRGNIDSAEPWNVLADLPKFALDALPAMMASYRRSLAAPPPIEHLTVLDATREFGSGVASWPRVRALVLVRGPSDDPGDDFILEVKEELDSTALGYLPQKVYYDDVAERIKQTSRTAWARPDAEPLWGMATWLDLRVQVRLETEAHKTLRVARLPGESESTLVDLSARLGALDARVHAAGPGIDKVAARFRDDVDGFADEQADFAASYAASVEQDWEEFKRALEKHGPRLGLPPSALDPPTSDLAKLLGDPP